jgi:hypothetical protein
VLSYGEKRTYISADIPGVGFTQDAGDNPDKSGSQTRLILNDRLIEAQKQVEQSAPGWINIPTETVAFTPVMTIKTETVQTEREVNKGRFRGTEKVVDVNTVDIAGSEHPVTMANADGEMEPAVLFQYSFSDKGKINPEGDGGKRLRYIESTGGRGGNELVVGLELPLSVATKLRDSIRDDPTLVRDLVEKLVLERSNGAINGKKGAINSENWNDEEGNRIKPPLKDLPPKWKIVMAWVEDDKFGIDTSKRFGKGPKIHGDNPSPYKVEELALAA